MLIRYAFLITNFQLFVFVYFFNENYQMKIYDMIFKSKLKIRRGIAFADGFDGCPEHTYSSINIINASWKLTPPKIHRLP